MKVLIVGPYPPYRDGVGRYVLQQAEHLESKGDKVEVMSPKPSAAHHFVDFKRGSRLAKLRKIAQRYDRVILHYQPMHYHDKWRGLSRIISNMGMLRAFSSITNLDIYCHEVDYPTKRVRFWDVDFKLERAAWNRASRVVFHTEAERDEMKRRLGADPPWAEFEEQGAVYHPHIKESKAEARSKLGIPTREKLGLCIGFVMRHKGFDRAIRAFLTLDLPNARLAVVGAAPTDDPENERHVAELKRLSTDPRIDLRLSVVTDEEFDRWIVASDVVILPYREIWSSGVLARAHILERPVIATAVGGISEQVHPSDVVVQDDDELCQAIAKALGGSTRGDQRAADVRSYEDAIDFVERMGAEKRGRTLANGSGSIGSLRSEVYRKIDAWGTVLPSSRPVVGPVLTIVKKLLHRWYSAPATRDFTEIAETLLDRIETLEKKTAPRPIEAPTESEPDRSQL